MPYDKGCHTVFHHRYHLVWITKYRFKLLKGAIRDRVREIIRQVCEEMGVTIINGVLSTDHVHMFVSILPHHSVSNVMRKVKGRALHARYRWSKLQAGIKQERIRQTKQHRELYRDIERYKPKP